jgi:hypothetical protein
MAIYSSLRLQNKTQVLLMITIVISIGSHFVGTLIPPSADQKMHGIVGYSCMPTLLRPSLDT